MDKKISGFMKDMEQRGEKLPLGARLLLSCGLPIRPLLFNNFGTNFIFLTFISGVLFGCLIYISDLFASNPPHVHLESVLITSILVGVLMGWVFSRRIENETKRLELPSWNDYTPPKS